MNREEAIWNEVVNGGEVVHAYRDALTGAWRAFGVSAYGLKELCCGVGCGFQEVFSAEMQMPCVTVPDAWMGMIECAAREVDSRRGDSVTLAVDFCVDMDDYIVWAQKVRIG